MCASETGLRSKRLQPRVLSGHTLNRPFAEEDVHTANEHMERCSTLLVVRKMPVTTMSQHYRPMRMTEMRPLPRAGKDGHARERSWS